MAIGDLLRRKQAAAYLQQMGCATTAETLANLAVNNNSGGGPPFIVFRNKRRNHVSYARKDLDDWAAKKLRRVE